MVEFLEEHVEMNLHDLELVNGFLDTAPKTHTATTKIDTLNFIKI